MSYGLIVIYKFTSFLDVQLIELTTNLHLLMLQGEYLYTFTNQSYEYSA